MTPQARNHVFPGSKGSGPTPFQGQEALEFVNLKETSLMLKAAKRSRRSLMPLETDSDDSRTLGSTIGEDATDNLSAQCTDTDSQMEDNSLGDEDSADDAGDDQTDDVGEGHDEERHDDDEQVHESNATCTRVPPARRKNTVRKPKKVEFVALVKDDVDGNNW